MLLNVFLLGPSVVSFFSFRFLNKSFELTSYSSHLFYVWHFRRLRFRVGLTVGMLLKYCLSTAIICFMHEMLLPSKTSQWVDTVTLEHIHFAYASTLPSDPAVPHRNRGFNVPSHSLSNSIQLHFPCGCTTNKFSALFRLHITRHCKPSLSISVCHL